MEKKNYLSELLKTMFSNKAHTNIAHLKWSIKLFEILIVTFAFVIPLFLTIENSYTNHLIEINYIKFKDSLQKIDLEISEEKNKLDMIRWNLFDIENRYLTFRENIIPAIDLNFYFTEYINEERESYNREIKPIESYQYSDKKWIELYKNEILEKINTLKESKLLKKDTTKSKYYSLYNYGKLWLVVTYVIVVLMTFRVSFLTYKVEKIKEENNINNSKIWTK